MPTPVLPHDLASDGGDDGSLPLSPQLPSPRAGIQSVEVGFALLAALSASSGPLMLRDVAAAASMSAAKAHRYLVSFQRLALVVQDPSTARYDLGPAALQLGLACLSRLDSVKLARQRMALLMGQVGQTLALAVWGNQGPTLVHWEEPGGPPLAMTVNLRLGDVMPLLSSATGLCFSAFLTSGPAHAPHPRLAPLLQDELRRAHHAGLPGVPSTLAEAADMFAEVRRRGIARVVNTLLPGVAGFCAPVFDADGHLALGMVAVGPLAGFDTQWDGAVAAPLRAAAAQLSADLGFRPA